jgi:hypothetical protein
MIHHQELNLKKCDLCHTRIPRCFDHESNCHVCESCLPYVMAVSPLLWGAIKYGIRSPNRREAIELAKLD